MGSSRFEYAVGIKDIILGRKLMDDLSEGQDEGHGKHIQRHLATVVIVLCA